MKESNKNKMTWHDVSDDDLNSALAAVKYGHDPDSALKLVQYFYERIHHGESYNEPVLLEYLHHTFGKIIEDECSANHAFGFKLKRGHYKRETTSERDVFAAAIMILLMRKGWTWLDAKGEAANRLFPDGKGEKAVEAAYKLYSDALSNVPNNLLMKMLPVARRS